MQDQPVVGNREQLPRDMPLQLQLRLKGSLRRSGEPNSGCDSKDMGVDRHNLAPPQHSPHNIGRLTTHPR